MKRYALFSVLLGATALAGLFFSQPAAAQDKRSDRRAAREAKALRVTKVTDSILRAQRFLFVPTRVVTSLPGMPYATLNTYYETEVTKDSLICSLPYYGYVYNSIYDPNKSPFFFTSTNFTYDLKGAAAGKERAWVTITARELYNGRAFSLTLEVFANGSAVLTMRGAGTQQLQYMGNVLPIPEDAGL